jgi:hypothetical protein
MTVWSDVKKSVPDNLQWVPKGEIDIVVSVVLGMIVLALIAAFVVALRSK